MLRRLRGRILASLVARPAGRIGRHLLGRGVGINGIAKDRGAEPRWIPIDGLAATATTPAYPVYKLNAGKGGSTPTAQCFSGSSMPPKNLGYGALTPMLCLSDWRCYNPYNKVCGEQAFADFGNDSAEYAPTP
jgi:hypothetical protein